MLLCVVPFAADTRPLTVIRDNGHGGSFSFPMGDVPVDQLILAVLLIHGSALI